MAQGKGGGRPPRPTSLKLLQGMRKDRINDAEPVPDDGEVLCPAWLPDRAREVWDYYAPDLIRKKVGTTWDVDLLADYCALVVINRDALDDLERNGIRILVCVRRLADGTEVFDVRKNPNWQIAKESAALLVTIGGRFGLNPSDRSRLEVDRGGKDSKPGEDLLSG